MERKSSRAYKCRECGTEVMCLEGEGCGVSNYLVCCGSRMQKVPPEEFSKEKFRLGSRSKKKRESIKE